MGHVMVSAATLRNGDGERKVSMLSPLAVRPDHQQRGIGSELARAALTAADDRGEPLVVLEGSPTFYGRVGFEPAERYAIEIALPSWAPPEAAQVARLSAFDANDPTMRGKVIYPAASDGLE